eukprot:TRINITY_DN9524_c0_g2_i2.p1 TRINITY_DN9524_c0_g2~~TRINITY_DN9524_c0_g2_i2.p1  ORF type:complete len:224 (+),score=43.44 TRINITY_DN9524_c0_g2_i2:65-736(+)
MCIRDSNQTALDVERENSRIILSIINDSNVLSTIQASSSSNTPKSTSADNNMNRDLDADPHRNLLTTQEEKDEPEAIVKIYRKICWGFPLKTERPVQLSRLLSDREMRNIITGVNLKFFGFEMGLSFLFVIYIAYLAIAFFILIGLESIEKRKKTQKPWVAFVMFTSLTILYFMMRTLLLLCAESLIKAYLSELNERYKLKGVILDCGRFVRYLEFKKVALQP